MIILDDVTKQGFEMIYQPIGFDGLKLIIDEIARFHALSLIIDDEVGFIFKYSLSVLLLFSFSPEIRRASL